MAVRIEPGPKSNTRQLGDALQHRAQQALEADFEANLTAPEDIEATAEKLGGPSEIVGTIAARKLREAFEAIRTAKEKLRRDPTQTPAAKVLRLEEEVRGTLKSLATAADAAIGEANRAAMEAEAELFSANVEPDSIDKEAIGHYLQWIKNGDLHPNQLLGTTESEGKISLVIAKRYPSALPKDTDTEQIERILNENWTPEAYHRVKAANDHRQAVIEAYEVIRTQAERLLPSDLIEAIKGAKT